MIKINLLPGELKPKESSFANIGTGLKEHVKAFKVLAMTGVSALILVHISLFLFGANNTGSIKALTQKNKQLLPDKKIYASLKAEVDMMNRKSAAIGVLMANRLIWAKKLNDLSDAMVPGIWLTGLSYEEKPVDPSLVAAPTSAMGDKKVTTKAEEKKAFLRYLTISGYATSMGEQGTALVGKFIKSMKDNPSFFSDFSEIKLESIKSEKVLDQEVMNFRITCLFK